MPESARKLLAEQVWMVTLFWLNYLKWGGEEVNDVTLRRGIDHLHLMLDAHLTDMAKRSLALSISSDQRTPSVPDATLSP